MPSPLAFTKPCTNSGSKFRAKFVAMAPGITFTTRIVSLLAGLGASG